MTLDTDGTLALADQHGEAELRGDLEGTLATLAPQPEWEVCGRLYSGTDEVSRFYANLIERVVPGIKGRDLRNRWVTLAGVVNEVFLDVMLSDGVVKRYATIAVMTFDGDKVKSLYFDPELANFILDLVHPEGVPRREVADGHGVTTTIGEDLVSGSHTP